MNDFKFKINEKVKYLDMIGTIIDAQLSENLGEIYLIRYENGKELWTFGISLEKVVE